VYKGTAVVTAYPQEEPGAGKVWMEDANWQFALTEVTKESLQG
jgi:hypothetical protein